MWRDSSILSNAGLKSSWSCAKCGWTYRMGRARRNRARRNLERRSLSIPEFPVQRGGKREGVLHVEPHGAIISGDTRAALEFLCEQLPGALDLSRLIDEKLRLERALGSESGWPWWGRWRRAFHTT